MLAAAAVHEAIPLSFSNVRVCPQEEDLQEVVSKVSMKQTQYDEAKDQMAKLKENYEEAEQEYKQHKESINTLLEEAESVKVVLGHKLTY